jgi:hypothetical protein
VQITETLSTFWSVLFAMLIRGEQLQVARVIVCPIPVPMVDMAAVRDLSIEGFPDNAM